MPPLPSSCSPPSQLGRLTGTGVEVHRRISASTFASSGGQSLYSWLPAPRPENQRLIALVDQSSKSSTPTRGGTPSPVPSSRSSHGRPPDSASSPPLSFNRGLLGGGLFIGRGARVFLCSPETPALADACGRAAQMRSSSCRMCKREAFTAPTLLYDCQSSKPLGTLRNTTKDTDQL